MADISMCAVIEVDGIYRTNVSKPGGLVKVLTIEQWSIDNPRLVARIEHIEDHPYGYKKGECGYYFVDELVPEFSKVNS